MISNKLYTIAIYAPNSAVTITSINTQLSATVGPLKIKANNNYIYQITENATGFAPQHIVARRNGKDLYIKFDLNTSDNANFIIEDYYILDNIFIIGQAEDNVEYPFIPNNANQRYSINKLEDGMITTQVLGGKLNFFDTGVDENSTEGNNFDSAIGLLNYNFILLGGGATAIAATRLGREKEGVALVSTIEILTFGNKDIINTSEQYAVTISGSAKNVRNKSIDLVLYNSDDSIFKSTAVFLDQEGNWSTTIDVSEAMDGNLKLKASAFSSINGNIIENVRTTSKDTFIDFDPININDSNTNLIPNGLNDWIISVHTDKPRISEIDPFYTHNRPPFKGTGEPGGMVQIALAGGYEIKSTVNSDGTWSATYPITFLPLLIGEQKLEVKVTDLAGNSQTGRLTLVVIDPMIKIQKFEGSITSTPNHINNTDQSIVTISGTTENTKAGDKVSISISDAGGKMITAYAVTDEHNVWTTTADVAFLNDGTLTASATVGTDIAGTLIVSSPHEKHAEKDTTFYTVEIEHNAEILDGSIQIINSKIDKQINAAEAAGGITYTIVFNYPVEQLTASDLLVTGGSVIGMPKANANSTDWTVVLSPFSADNGILDLTLSTPKISTLFDAAGNPAFVIKSSPIWYDTLPPSILFSDINGKNSGFSTDLALDNAQIFVLNGNETASSYTIGTAKANGLDQTTNILFEGIGSANITSQNTITLNQHSLNALRQGFYSLEVSVTDAVGNTTQAQQIIGKNTGGFPSSGFISVLGPGHTLVGDNNDNFIINRNNIHETVTLGGSMDRDTVFMLKTGLGKTGAPDYITVKDFNPTINADILRLDDLFDGSVTHNHIRFESLDLDSNGTLESIRIYINTDGLLSNNMPLSQTAQQVITLENIQMDIPEYNNASLPPFQNPAWIVI